MGLMTNNRAPITHVVHYNIPDGLRSLDDPSAVAGLELGAWILFKIWQLEFEHTYRMVIRK